MNGPDNVTRFPDEGERLPGEIRVPSFNELLHDVENTLDRYGVPRGYPAAERVRRALEGSRVDLLRQFATADPDGLRAALTEALGEAHSPSTWRIKVVAPDFHGPLFGVRLMRHKRRLAFYALPFGGLEITWPG